MGAVYLFLHVKLLVNAFTSPRYVIFLGARPSFEKGAEILALALLLLVVMMLFSRSLRGVFKRYLKYIIALLPLVVSNLNLLLGMLPADVVKQLEGYLANTGMLVKVLTPQQLLILVLTSVLPFIPACMLLYLLLRSEVEVVDNKVWFVWGRVLSAFENSRLMQAWGYECSRKIAGIKSEALEVSLEDAISEVLSVLKPKEVVFYIDPKPPPVGRDELKLVKSAKLLSSGTLSVWVY
ncbi:MAG: hypothetical protein DRJ67_11995, partial [Thermoprotei archaeon]